ncbi:MAG TPA: tetratricopeptide repeat protein, partial [Bacteroidales bacterium]|nr:tetratricopeptide repeat protein [Bacteroidales bacterium]
ENLGVAYGLKKDFLKSIEFFKKSIEIKPENPQTYLNLAGSYQNIGDKEKANQCYQKALQLQKK